PCPKNYAPAGSGIDQITAQNSAQPADRIFGTVGSEVPSITTSNATSTGLFPFSNSAYSIFPGLCLPGPVGGGIPAGLNVTTTLTPGASPTIDMRLPEFDVNILYKTSKGGATSPATGARIVLDRQAGYG